MKFLSLALLTFSMVAGAAAVKRKVSSTDNYYCLIERDGADRKNYAREYRFPFPASGESYELKGSLKFNKYSLEFENGAPVKISFSEYIDHEVVTGSQTKAMEGTSLKTSVELKKNTTVITYNIDCHPE